MSQRNLDGFFQPKSIALIGASKSAGSLGYILARNMMQAGFDGPIMPVDPKHQAIGGMLTWKRIADLPIIPDCAVVSLPLEALLGVILELREKGAKAVVILTPDFNSEEMAAPLMQAAGDMRILGPNSLGLIVPGVGLNASYAPTQPKAGDVALIAQSDAVLTTMLDWADAKDLGFSHVIALSDMVDVDYGDLLDYLAADPKVRAILLYVERITQARKFMSAARAASRVKPVIVLKSGHSDEGAAAAASHTGALAGRDKVYDVAFRRAGMLRVHDMHELFEAVQTVSSSLRNYAHSIGDRLAILTNGGGVGIMATDALIEEGGQLAQLTEDSLEKLAALMPKGWSRSNPVDLTDVADSAHYQQALDILLHDKNCDAVLVMNAPQALHSSDAIAKSLVEGSLTKRTRLPVLTCWLGERLASKARKRFEMAGIPSFSTPDEAITAFMHLVQYRTNQDALMQVPSPSQSHGNRSEQVRIIIDQILAEGRTTLTEYESKKILEAYDIPVSKTLLAGSGAEAAEKAIPLLEQGPVVIKISSQDIPHKSDVGGVVLGVETKTDVQTVSDQMLAKLADQYPEAHIDGVTIQPMVKTKTAHELIIGAYDDPHFGPAILFGQGGKAVEVVGDTAMALPPLNMLLAKNLVKETKIWGLLQGYRDEAAANLEAILDGLIQVAQLMIDFPEISELDINPFLVDQNGAVALDASLSISTPKLKGTDRLAIKPYPKKWEGILEGRKGHQAPMRPLRPDDAPALKDLVEACDPDDIRLRFLHPMKAMPDKLAARLSQLDYDREIAFLAHESEADDAPIIAVGQLTNDPRTGRAEYAIIIRSDQKGKGYGYTMMQHLLAYARQSDIATVYGEVLAENYRMLNLCKDLGFSVKNDPDDLSLRHVEIDTRS